MCGPIRLRSGYSTSFRSIFPDGEVGLRKTHERGSLHVGHHPSLQHGSVNERNLSYQGLCQRTATKAPVCRPFLRPSCSAFIAASGALRFLKCTAVLTIPGNGARASISGGDLKMALEKIVSSLRAFLFTHTRGERSCSRRSDNHPQDRRSDGLRRPQSLRCRAHAARYFPAQYAATLLLGSVHETGRRRPLADECAMDLAGRCHAGLGGFAKPCERGFRRHHFLHLRRAVFHSGSAGQHDEIGQNKQQAAEEARKRHPPRAPELACGVRIVRSFMRTSARLISENIARVRRAEISASCAIGSSRLKKSTTATDAAVDMSGVCVTGLMRPKAPGRTPWRERP